MAKSKTTSLDAIAAATNVATKAPRRRTSVYANAGGRKSEPSHAEKAGSEITKTEISIGGVRYEAERMEINPANARVNPKTNARNQRFLSERNRQLMELVQAIAVDGQRDAVFVRPVKNEAGRFDHYEVIAGSRRLWAVNYLNEKAKSDGDQQRLLKAINILDMQDAAARALSISENQDRADESPYEIGCAIAEEAKRVSVDKAAADFKISRSKAFELRKLSAIDEAFIERLGDPNLLGYRSGLELVKLVESAEESDRVYEAVFEKLQTGATSGDLDASMVSSVIREVSKELKPQSDVDQKPDHLEGEKGAAKQNPQPNKPAPKKRAPKKLALGGNRVGKCSQHRERDDKYTISLGGMSEKDIMLVIEAIEGVLKS